MSLYEDDDLGPPPTDVALGWSKGVKLLQSHIQLKKASAKTIPESHSLVGPRLRPAAPVLAPVIDLKSKQKVEDPPPPSAPLPNLMVTKSQPSDKGFRSSSGSFTGGIDKSLLPLSDGNNTIANEYDPLWPNDYYKVVQEMRDKRHQGEDPIESKKRRYSEAGRERARERFNRNDERRPERSSEYTGLGSEMMRRRESDSDEEDDDRRRNRRNPGSSGAAIAPPPSLTESSPSAPIEPQHRPIGPQGGSLAGLGIAAKIMAKYGYKHGQGLGRAEQGMSQALAVEKTSKRGGRIVHEKDLMPPPMFGESFKTPSTPPNARAGPATPPSLEFTETDPSDQSEQTEAEAKPSITDLLKNPSKVVLCKNMVGPGEVDDELEPEVKEECNTKYGDVISVVILEVQNTTPEETVRIFIEFKRVESAIKAVVDLNGRFFGGREVRASFYDVFKFQNRQLND